MLKEKFIDFIIKLIKKICFKKQVSLFNFYFENFEGEKI